MKKVHLVLFAVFFLITACSSTSNTIDNSSTETEETASEVNESPKTAPTDWHHLSSDSEFIGAGTEKTYSEILSNRTPSKKVIVAIIDSGTDLSLIHI